MNDNLSRYSVFISVAFSACKSGGYYDCSDLQYTSDYQTGVYYCCADADLRPVLAGTLGTASLTCSCYTTAEVRQSQDLIGKLSDLNFRSRGLRKKSLTLKC